MSHENLITPDVKNADLYRAYFRCCAHASKLRFSVTSKPIINKTAFNGFKRTFDFLFMLSGNRRELNDYSELVERTKEWLMTSSTIPSISLANKGIELFDEFQKVMIETQLVNDK